MAETAEVNGTKDIDDINRIMINSDGKRMDATLPQSNDSNPLKPNTAGNRMKQYSLFWYQYLRHIFTHFFWQMTCPFVFIYSLYLSSALGSSPIYGFLHFLSLPF